MEDNRIYWLALSLVQGVGAILFKRLIEAFGSPRNVFEASPEALQQVDGVGAKTAHHIKTFFKTDILRKQLQLLEKHRVQIVTLSDSNYPELLRNIFDPPPVLYVKGTFSERDQLAVAVVGSRKSSSYGRLTAEKICLDLVSRGVTIVSGLARGIDSFAHRGALKGGGRTIAVLGNGVDCIYPRENRRLYEAIVEKGAVISEFPLGTPPDRKNFPVRNRIISGLSLGVVVVEAGDQSGALITADQALEQGREVLAIPGNVSSYTSRGTHRLIKQGAKLVETAEDILEELSLSRIGAGTQIQPLLSNSSRSIPPHSPERKGMISSSPFLKGLKGETTPPLEDLTEDEKSVYAVIGSEPLHVDEIVHRLQRPAGFVLGVLMMLEMKNKIKQLSGKMFIRNDF
ncbi:MAG TPA: DNA-processing protein DprA [Candidatus Limnocylindrales bacterium]|nr:DNA-processing protein DprA [Candidatus Limnocylindrales bacterium]